MRIPPSSRPPSHGSWKRVWSFFLRTTSDGSQVMQNCKGALGHGSELVQWIGRVVEAKTFDEKRGVVRSLMGAGGGCSELVGRLLMG